MYNVAGVILLFLFVTSHVIGQKPVVDTTVEGNWPTFENGKISSDGKYVAYRVNYIYRQQITRSYLVCKAVSSDWKIEINGQIRSFEFDYFSKRIIIETSGDSLQILHLGSNRLVYFTNVRSFQLSQSHLICQIDSVLRIHNLLTEKDIVINNVVNYVFHKVSKNLLVERNISGIQEILLQQLSTGRQYTIESVPNAKILIFNTEGNQIAILGNESDSSILLLYDISRKRLKKVIQGDLGNIFSNLYLSGISHFTANSRYLVIRLRSKNVDSLPRQQCSEDSVEIWSYSDIIPADYTVQEDPQEEFRAVVNLSTGRILLLEQEGERVSDLSNDYAIISKQLGNGLWDEKYWTNHLRRETYLVYFRNGIRKKLTFDLVAKSPTGKYLLFYKEANYFTFDTQTGVVCNITKSIKTDWTIYLKDSIRDVHSKSVDIFGHIWLKDDDAIILHDQFDLWQVDPAGKRSAICLTNQYGYKNKISFHPYGSSSLFKNGERLFIPALDRNTKDNGFFYVTIGKSVDPEKVVLNQYLYFIPHEYAADGGEYPSKAENENIWLVRRMSAADYPNYYTTIDFKNFNPVSNFNPEKKFNWLVTELHDFPDSSGRMIQGVLYKPEDFNPAKQHPIIFYYYEKCSNNLNSFLPAALSMGPLNIPWYVSRGYLVFTPDIHYLVGHTNKSALSTVTSAARYIMKLPYVDSSRMGLQGHSFGAIQTNFIITHTRLFAAACSASGISNFISNYGRMGQVGPGARIMTELGQLRMGATLWESPQYYIENSPVFFLHKITTPLLMMHTDKDNMTTLAQAAEMFNGMRRLGKTCWLLLYKKENHILHSREHRLDFTQRMQQFFDYYLKANPVPEWMIKSGSTSLSLDANGELPFEGILSEQERRKIDSINYRKPITITIP